jgi:hypothetical protein
MRETWFKSSYSGGNNDCLEARWAKSSHSGATNPDCVECRTDNGRVHIRDTQHRHLGHLELPESAWRALLGAVRRGEL